MTNVLVARIIRHQLCATDRYQQRRLSRGGEQQHLCPVIVNELTAPKLFKMNRSNLFIIVFYHINIYMT